MSGPSMRKAIFVLIVLLPLAVFGQYVTYWFQGWQRQGDAADAQAYFMRPGTNIIFTYASNRVYINASGTITNIAVTTNALYAQYSTNWLGSNALYLLLSDGTNAFSTNSLYAVWSTNWSGSNDFWITLTNAIYNATNGFSGGGGASNAVSTILTNGVALPVPVTNLNFIAGSNVTLFATNVGGQVNLEINSTGGGGTTTNGTPGFGLTDGLFAYWKFDDFSSPTYDSWTNNFLGTLLNGPQFQSPPLAQVGPGALKFIAASSQSMRATDLTNMQFASGSGTITWWMYPTDAWNSGVGRGLWGQYRDGSAFVGVYINAGNAWQVGWQGSAFSFAASADNYPQNTWMHYAFTWFPTGSALYTNGVLCASSGTAVTEQNVGQPFNIGYFPHFSIAGSPYANAIFDDFRIYSTNLTGLQIQQVYQYNGLLDFYVLKTGDIMTGQLSVRAPVDITGITMGHANMIMSNAPGGDLSDYQMQLYGGLFIHTNGIDDGMSGIELIASQLSMFDTNDTETITANGVLGRVRAQQFTTYTSGGLGFYGAHYGDGAGLTNIPFATSASNATNFWGTLSNTNLPSWVAYTTSNNVFSTSNVFQGSLVVTGANHLALSNGTARVLMTNGNVTASGGLFTSAASTIGGVLTIGSSSFLVNEGSATLQFGNDDAAGNPTAQIIKGCDSFAAFVTNGVGGNITLSAGRNTGTNIGGSVFFATSGPRAAGTSAGTLTNQASIDWKGDMRLVGSLTATNGVTSPNGAHTATNFVTGAIKWVDIPMNYGYSTLGPSAPPLTDVTNAPNTSAIQALAFDNNDILYAQAQFPHTLAITNASFQSFYFEPHIHFDTIGTLDSAHSNVTWRIEWQVAAINGIWYSGTNSATIGVTNNFTHYILDLGHITNNAPLGISAIFRCRLMRPASAGQDYSNAHDVILDGFDLHVPVGNLNAIGSSTDTAP